MQYLVEENRLTAIADSIRSKTGGSDTLTLEEMPIAIEGIETGGGGGDIDALIDGSITEISSNATEIYKHAFYERRSLISVSIPNATSVSVNAFWSCNNLASVSIPNATSVGNYAFNNCTNLTDLNAPLLTTFGTCSFYGCQSLASIDLHHATKLGTNTFESCKNLSVIILRNSTTICSLGNVNVLKGTPFASGGTGGTVYCPQALIEQYQNATNWSTLYTGGTCTFVAIEGSEYE